MSEINLYDFDNPEFFTGIAEELIFHKCKNPYMKCDKPTISDTCLDCYMRMKYDIKPHSCVEKSFFQACREKYGDKYRSTF